MEISKAQAVEPRSKVASRTIISTAGLSWAMALVLLVAGLGLRLFDLTDPPLDFHATRQLRSAIIARGMYYKMLPAPDPLLRERAIGFWNTMGRYEPSILENLVARTYLLIGEETLWVARIYSAAFWIIGGLALFALAKRLASPPAALAALAYYLFLPFAVQASRSFQPDPWMVMWFILSIYSMVRWSEKQEWKWALLAGAFGGAAVLIKVVAAYLVGAAAIALVLHTLGLKRFWRSPQVYAMAALMVAPPLVYYLLEMQGRSSQYFADWSLSLSHLLLSPAFYMRWLSLVQDLMNLAALMLGLVGVLIARPRSRALLSGLWLGYLAYGLFLPYQMYTHNYYHLQLVPILGLSLVPVVELLLEKVSEQAWIWQLPVIGAGLVGLIFPAWVSYADMKAGTYRGEPANWQEIAQLLPDDGKIIALTQDYGYRIMYYGWRRVIPWPNKGEINLAVLRGNQNEFESFFADRTEDKSYFLITAFGQYQEQPKLQEMLESNYPVYAEGNGYLIYNLEHPLATGAP